MLASIAGSIPGVRRMVMTPGGGGASGSGARAGPGSRRHSHQMSGIATSARPAPNSSAWPVVIFGSTRRR